MERLTEYLQKVKPYHNIRIFATIPRVFGKSSTFQAFPFTLPSREGETTVVTARCIRVVKHEGLRGNL